MPWPESRLEAIDRWFYSCCSYAFRRQSKVVDSLPYVFDIEGVDKVVFTSICCLGHPRRVTLAETLRAQESEKVVVWNMNFIFRFSWE